MLLRIASLLFSCIFLMASAAFAAVLPEDRADAMYHRYDGGGITIDGPSVLVRKGVTKDVSVNAQYYVDQITSASIDVIASGASEYTEERTEYTVGADYLVNKSILSAGFTNSSENDYEASTYFLGISQDFFGDLSTLSLSYSYGADEVGNSTDLEFSEEVRRQSYQFSWTQVMTKDLLINAVYHIITDQGYLNNPYRSYRFLTYDGTGNVSGTGSATEIYPNTRTSHAVAIRGKYFLPYRAAIAMEYRLFDDTWGIEADNVDIGYSHPIGQHWILDAHFRLYQQTEASFYSDLFSREGAQNYMARDKEMSQFSTQTFGFSVSYEAELNQFRWLEKAGATLTWDYIQFDYDNFRDASKTNYAPGTEPLYSFDANVLRLYISAWF